MKQSHRYLVLLKRSFYVGTANAHTRDILMGGDSFTKPVSFASREEAVKAIAEFNQSVWHLSYGEYSRPQVLRIVTVDSAPKWARFLAGE